MANLPDGNRVLEAVRVVLGAGTVPAAATAQRRSVARGPRPGPGSGECWVALSGGVDSTVLLDAAARVLGGRAQERLAAVHVNHGLHPNAGAWEDHCREAARRLGLRLEVRRVAVRRGRGQGGIEAAARAARLAALREAVPPGACILLGHHRDDQAETVLLRILRGAGPAGMAAMRPVSLVGGLRLVRPLLAVARAEILAYARERGLAWVEDPGNLTVALDRNHLRHRVLPALAERWPEVRATLGAHAERAHEVELLLDALAAEDLAAARGRAPGTLSTDAIAALPAERAANALRAWLVARHGAAPPPRRWLRILVEEVAGARGDRSPEAARDGIRVRRYRGDLHAGPERVAPRLPASTPWRPDRGPLELPHGRLVAVRAEGEGIAVARLLLPAEVRFRRGGERCRPAGRALTKPLKDLFQELGVPPWERGLRPLVFAGGRLAAVPGLFLCDPFAACGNEPAWRIEWRPRRP